MEKPILVERFSDNGEHSHWELIDKNGEVLWDSWDKPFSSKEEDEKLIDNLQKRQKELDELIADYKEKLSNQSNNKMESDNDIIGMLFKLNEYAKDFGIDYGLPMHGKHITEMKEICKLTQQESK